MPPPRAPNPAALRDRFALAQAMHQRGRLAEAEAIYRELLRLDPRNADALHFLGLISLQTNKAAEGVRLIEKAVAFRPAYPEALSNLGIGYSELGRHKDALATFDKALALRPNLPALHDGRGNALRDLGRPEEALVSFDKAIALQPDDAGAYSNRANVLRDLERWDDALASYDRALALAPGFVEARCNRGIALHAMKRNAEALEELDRVVAAAPGYPQGHYERGNLLLDMERPEAALECFAKAIAMKPDYAEAFNSQGNALRALHRDEDSLASYGKAVALVPTYAAPYYNAANALAALREERAALVQFDRALELKPNDPEALRARGLALAALKRYQEALADFDKALALKPDMKWLPGDALSVRRQICDWSGQDKLEVIRRRIEADDPAAAPFTLFGAVGDPALHSRAAEVMTKALFPPRAGSLPAHKGHEKLRLAYVSADFRDHAMMHIMIDLFRAHDRSLFEVIALSFGPDTGDEQRRRVQETCDRFIDIRTMSDHDAVALARRLEIDIAIDLMGYTHNCRTGLFSRRLAPVQIQYLGYPGTMGAPYIDYLIADPLVIPLAQRHHYCEAIAWLPETYQANTREHPAAARVPTRQDCGLPEDAFVFCCFNNTYKLAPAMFDIWMRILHAFPKSVLWLYHENDIAVTNLRAEASSRGIPDERLVFAPKRPLGDHLARQALADLFLDTQPYNGHATASLALWAGVPLLTMLGESFPGRVAASLLTAVGLPEMIAPSAEAYFALAVGLAAEPPRLRALRERLAANRTTHPLFDTDRFARHIEAAFTAMQARAAAGLPPADITVDALRDP